MALTSRISGYDPEWPPQFAAERERLAPIFGPDLIRVDHVGSTAVPGLSAKPEIDILVELVRGGDIDRHAPSIISLGYVRGGDLSDGHHFFRKNAGGVRTHKLHVLAHGHSQVWRMLSFRDHLRSNPAARQAYQNLKLKLEAENTRGIGEYLEGKAPFIERMLEDIREAGA
jgi:GrpB-like predicted nucleotidyltransferase (UPF0157 family)